MPDEPWTAERSIAYLRGLIEEGIAGVEWDHPGDVPDCPTCKWVRQARATLERVPAP